MHDEDDVLIGLSQYCKGSRSGSSPVTRLIKNVVSGTSTGLNGLSLFLLNMEILCNEREHISVFKEQFQSLKPFHNLRLIQALQRVKIF